MGDYEIETTEEIEPGRLMVYEPRADGQWRAGMFLGALRMTPTPADIVAHLAAQPDGGDALLRELLRADPDRAVRVVDGADIARPWDDGRREPLNALGGHPVAEVVVGELVTEWLVGDTLGTIADGESRTAEAAEAAADAALLADGWVLAGGGR